MSSIDILVIGATGFVGKLVTRYLQVHPQRDKFKLGLAARSQSKLADLVTDLRINPDDVPLIIVDTLHQESVDAAVKRARVVINTVGPYMKWSTRVVKSCARLGKHYVDITGETLWIAGLIQEYDYLASKTGAIIVPSCGFDSLPSDISAYISIRALRSQVHPSVMAKSSVTSQLLKYNGGASGGTMASIIYSFEEIPRHLRTWNPYILSPMRGPLVPPVQLLYTLPASRRTLHGSMWPMAPVNGALVRRTWGLLQMEDKENAYGPEFSYEEIFQAKSALHALCRSSIMAIGFLLLTYFPPAFWLFKFLARKPGQGPSEKQMQSGAFDVTNVTTTAPSPSIPQQRVETVLKFTGDPGYLMTAVMVSECALALVFDQARLPRLARSAGILTPVTAFGDVIVERLTHTGRVTVESKLLDTGDRKTR